MAKLNVSGAALVNSTYLGGNAGPIADDYATGIAVDSSGNAYVIGMTYTTNFPTAHPLQASESSGDAFVVKIVDGGRRRAAGSPNAP